MDMVERVAKALAEHLMGVNLAFTEPAATDTPTIVSLREADTLRAMAAARAAIEAMREPTEAMLNEGLDTGMFENEVTFATTNKPKYAWECMINAALSPTP